jgi:hypothetical protein
MHMLLCLDPRRDIREALEQVLLHLLQAIVGRSLSRGFARKLSVKVGHIGGGRDLW